MLASFRNVRNRRERGATLVEFALVVPILLMVLFGIIDFGYVVNRDTLINNASREGAREASLNPDAGAIDSVVRSALGDLDGTIIVQSSCRKANNSACSLNDSRINKKGNVAPGDRVVVTVRYQHGWLTFVPRSVGMGSTSELSKTTEMRVE